MEKCRVFNGEYTLLYVISYDFFKLRVLGLFIKFAYIQALYYFLDDGHESLHFRNIMP